MFKVDFTQEFKWPVTVRVPNDGGGFKNQTFTAIFKITDEEPGKDKDDDEEILVADIIKSVLIGWEGVTDADKNELEFCDENVDKILKIAYVRTALLKSYTNAMTGQKAKRKN